MKTKDLIDKLKEADPSGDLECCIGNCDIIGIHTDPGYWDGCLQVLERDEKGRIKGGKYCSGQTKVVIRTYSIRDFVVDNNNFKVSYDGDYARKHYEPMIKEAREWSDKLHDDVEKGMFVKYMVRRTNDQYCDLDEEEIVEAAKEFYDANLNYRDEMPKDVLHTKKKKKHGDTVYDVIPSWCDRREMQWDREVHLTLENGKLKVVKKTKE